MHIQEDQLDRYAMGTLPQESLAGVEEHLLVCPVCQNRLVEADQFLQAFRSAAAQLNRAPARRTGTWPRVRFLWAGAAAAVVFAAVLVSTRPGTVPLPPPAVMVQSLRGPEAGVRVAASRPFLMVFDIAATPGAAAHKIEVVDAEGREILKPAAGAQNGWLTASIRQLPRGSYWVRVYRAQAARELLSEYRVQAE
jgi:anti-sigma factor RsiW